MEILYGNAGYLMTFEVEYDEMSNFVVDIMRLVDLILAFSEFV